MTKENTMTALAHTEEAAVPALAEGSAIIQMIERAVLDPRVDIDKMERLLAMQERVMERNARVAFTVALAEMQPKLPVITEKGRIEVPAKDGKTGHSTPYAKWEDINDAIRPLLSQYGFSLTFRTGVATDGKITVTGILSHREGHHEETTVTLTHDSSGSKNAVQAVGSSYSYGKRYAAFALLNITTRGEDDDGRMAGADWITEDQVGDLLALMDDVKADRARFLNFLRIDTFAHLPKSRYNEALAALEAKRVRA